MQERAAKARAWSEADEVAAMIEALRAEVHRELGFGSFFEYAETVSDLGGRALMDRIRVVEAALGLPGLRAALAERRIGLSAARELVRVATPETEAAWLAAAAGKTVREIEKLVSGHRPGDQPDEPPDPMAMRRTVALELSSGAYAVFCALKQRIEAALGQRADDDALVSELARGYELGVASDAADHGTARYQIAITRCDSCDRAFQDGGGKTVEIDTCALSRALCDAEVIDAHGKLSQDIPKATRRAVKRRDHHRCTVPGCRNACFVEPHHLKHRSQGGGHELRNLLSLCSSHHDAVHRGRLLLRGASADAVTFFHPDGTPYGDAPTWARPSPGPQARPTWAASAEASAS